MSDPVTSHGVAARPEKELWHEEGSRGSTTEDRSDVKPRVMLSSLDASLTVLDATRTAGETERTDACSG